MMARAVSRNQAKYLQNADNGPLQVQRVKMQSLSLWKKTEHKEPTETVSANTPRNRTATPAYRNTCSQQLLAHLCAQFDTVCFDSIVVVLRGSVHKLFNGGSLRDHFASS